jgi:signal peptidase II
MRKWLPLLLVCLVVITVDQIAKTWVIETLPFRQSIVFIPALHPFLQITYTTNTGVAFGIGIGGNTFVLVLSVIIVCGLLIYYGRISYQSALQPVGLGLVIGGALGNVIDRVQYGAVIDFVHITIPGLVSNVSNFADHAIVIGVGVLLLEAWLQDRKEKRQQSTPPEGVESAT